MSIRKKRLIWVLGITLAVMLTVYLARRPLFESMIKGEIIAALESALGVDVEVGAVRGSWLTDVLVDDLTIRGGPDSAFQEIIDVDIELDFSPFTLISGDLRGLVALRIRGERAVLHLDKAWSVPSTSPPDAGPASTLAELLGILARGASIEFDELVLAPNYVADGPISIRLAPGEGKRQLDVSSGQTKAIATIDLNGDYDVEISGEEAGRLVRALRIAPDAVDRGSLRGSIRGNTTAATLQSDLDLATESTTGTPLTAHYEVKWAEGRLLAPKVHIDLPGVTVSGNNLDLPIEALTRQAIGAILARQEAGTLFLRISDLTNYRDLLPKPLHQFLPITGELSVTVDKGRITLQPSLIKGKGIELRLSRGTIAIRELAATPAFEQQLRTATATAIGFTLTIPEPLTIALPESEPFVVAGRITGSVSGTLAKPDATAEVALREVRYRELRIDHVGGSMAFDGRTLSLTNAIIRGAKRAADRVGFAVDGRVSIEFTGEDGPRITCNLQGAVPPEVLKLAPLPDRLRDRITLPRSRIVADVRLPTDFAKSHPTGTARIECEGIIIGELQPFDLLCRGEMTADGQIRIEEFTLTGAATTLSATGTLALEAKTLDVIAKARLGELLPLCRLLGQHDLTGDAVIESLTAKGPLSAPNIRLQTRVNISSYSPNWFPTGVQADLPSAPITIAAIVGSTPTGLDVADLQLLWGQPERRIEIRGGGAVPLKWTSAGLVATTRDTPIVLNLQIAVDTPKPRTQTIKVDGEIQIAADGVTIPTLVVRSPEGFFKLQDTRVGFDLAKVLDDSLDWRDISIAGGIELSEVWLGRITQRLSLDANIEGLITGDITLAGRLGKPRVRGAITIARGNIAFDGMPELEAITGTAKFDEKSIAIDYEARTRNKVPLKIIASLTSDSDTLWEALVDRTADVTGELSVQGLDLAQFQESFPNLPKLHGRIEIDGTFTLRPDTIDPDLTIVLESAGWQLRDSDQHVEGVSASAHLSRSEIELTRFEGVIPGLKAQLKIAGRLAVDDAALWEILTDKNPGFHGFVEFSDIPLDVLPRGFGLDAAEGVAAGRLDLAGTFADMRPKLVATVRNAALKFASVPRIANLNAEVRGDQNGCTLEAKATMGAGPLTVIARFTPAEGELFDAYADGSIHVTVKGERVLLLRTGGLKVRGDVNLEAKGKLDRVAVTGEVTLDKSRYVKRLSLVPDLKVTAGQSTGNTFGPWSIPGGERLSFDVLVKTKDPVEVRTNVVDTDLDLNCRLQGPGTALHLAGGCTSRSGTIRLPGMAMRIASLRLVFPKAAPTRPELLATASGQRHGIRINMNLRGPWDDLIITMSSNPALQPRELWSLATTGVRPESLAENSVTSNSAIIATYVIQELLLTYIASESTEASESFVSRFTFEFGREISRDGAETWEVNFDIGDLWFLPPRFGLRFERDVYEDFNLGLVYRWRF